MVISYIYSTCLRMKLVLYERQKGPDLVGSRSKGKGDWVTELIWGQLGYGENYIRLRRDGIRVSD
jgi:hypothetical protein